MVKIKIFLFETLASIGLVDVTKVSSEIVTLLIVVGVRVAFYFLERYVIKKIKKNG